MSTVRSTRIAPESPGRIVSAETVGALKVSPRKRRRSGRSTSSGRPAAVTRRTRACSASVRITASNGSRDRPAAGERGVKRAASSTVPVPSSAARSPPGASIHTSACPSSTARMPSSGEPWRKVTADGHGLPVPCGRPSSTAASIRAANGTASGPLIATTSGTGAFLASRSLTAERTPSALDRATIG